MTPITGNDMFLGNTVYGQKDGQYVHVSDVESGLSCGCTCVVCGVPLVAKKGGVNAHHFAHVDHTETVCTPGKVLHETSKNLLYNALIECIATKTPFHIEWECRACTSTHKGNLLKRAIYVQTEKRAGNSIADILLLDTDRNPIIAIEVVCTHDVEKLSWENYDDLGIEVVEWHPVHQEKCDREINAKKIKGKAYRCRRSKEKLQKDYPKKHRPKNIIKKEDQDISDWIDSYAASIRKHGPR